MGGAPFLREQRVDHPLSEVRVFEAIASKAGQAYRHSPRIAGESTARSQKLKNSVTGPDSGICPTGDEEALQENHTGSEGGSLSAPSRWIRTGLFVIPNPWGVGSARVLAGLGFEACFNGLRVQFTHPIRFRPLRLRLSGVELSLHGSFHRSNPPLQISHRYLTTEGLLAGTLYSTRRKHALNA